MSAASCVLTEAQFLCSICLDVFTDPVTIPCGHNFCKTCITEHWNSTKLKARKSCLVCLVSYCETHLKSHLTMSVLKRHQLIDPVKNLEDRMCTKHDKLLELFCKNDQTFVCLLCSVSDHRTHNVVPLKEEYEEKKPELGKTEAEIQQMIEERTLKIQDIKSRVVLSQEDSDREIAEGVQVFLALMESVESSLNKLIDTVKRKQKETEIAAEGFIKDLEQEISKLKKRSDQLHVLQMVGQLEETLSRHMKKVFEAEMKRIKNYAVDLTLNPDTAHPNLILSDDWKQVYCSNVKKNLSDSPERFATCPCVLSKEGFSSGRFYFEVQVRGKTDWDLGVARESINRKGKITLNPHNGYWTICLKNESKLYALAGPPVRLSLKSQLENVGVFVDYEEGVVSFYDADATAPIYFFTGCSFTEKLYPYFSPDVNHSGKNSAPLIVSHFNHTQ
uniref:Uncharacterized protein n=1 Tax=Labrus bergylta TaxID=56723 RepID=A0A3Q3EBZ7_9LABR